MPGLMPGIDVLAAIKQKGRGWRDKPGHDEKRIEHQALLLRDSRSSYICSNQTLVRLCASNSLSEFKFNQWARGELSNRVVEADSEFPKRLPLVERVVVGSDISDGE
jgi:hypothetical protein